MNCKEGDLAVVVDAAYDQLEFIGCFCRVLKSEIGIYSGVPVWSFTDATGPLKRREWSKIRDMYLRPIRDQPGTDETLDWCPVPNEKVKA